MCHPSHKEHTAQTGGTRNVCTQCVICRSIASKPAARASGPSSAPPLLLVAPPRTPASGAPPINSRARSREPQWCSKSFARACQGDMPSGRWPPEGFSGRLRSEGASGWVGKGGWARMRTRELRVPGAQAAASVPRLGPCSLTPRTGTGGCRTPRRTCGACTCRRPRRAPGLRATRGWGSGGGEEDKRAETHASATPPSQQHTRRVWRPGQRYSARVARKPRAPRRRCRTHGCRRGPRSRPRSASARA